MKKSIFIAAASLSLLFTGCGESTDESPASNNESSISSEESSILIAEQTDTSSEEMPETTDVSDSKDDKNSNIIASTDNYSVTMECIEHDVYYAQISGLSDTAVQNKINDTLKSIEQGRFDEMQAMVDQAIAQYNEASDAGELTDEMIDAYDQIQKQGAYFAEPTVNYADNEKISIVQHAWFGYDSIEEARGEDLSSSTTVINLNIATGDELELSDFCNIPETAEKIFNNTDVEIIDGYEGASVEDYVNQTYIQTLEAVEEDLAKRAFTFDKDGNLLISLNSGKGGFTVAVK